MKTFKKSLALLLALVMCLGCMSLPAFAAEYTVNDGVAEVATEEDLRAAVADESVTSVKLISNITLTETLAIAKTLTLDGNGYTITGSAETLISISDAVTATIQNVTVNGSGDSVTGGIAVTSGADVTLNDVLTTGTYNDGAPVCVDGATVTITGENTDIPVGGGGYAIDTSVAPYEAPPAEKKSVVNITNGHIGQIGAVSSSATRGPMELTVSGGTVNGIVSYHAHDKIHILGTAAISGLINVRPDYSGFPDATGFETLKVDGGTLACTMQFYASSLGPTNSSFTGGTFTNASGIERLKEWFEGIEAYDYSNGSSATDGYALYGEIIDGAQAVAVKPATTPYGAIVDQVRYESYDDIDIPYSIKDASGNPRGSGYETLEDALKAVENGDTVYTTESTRGSVDCVDYWNSSFFKNKIISLDFEGCTVDGDSSTALRTAQSYNITVKNGTFRNNSLYTATVIANNGTTITIEGGVFAANYPTNGQVLKAQKGYPQAGTIIVKGGYFKGAIVAEDGGGWYYSGVLTITGGHFTENPYKYVPDTHAILYHESDEYPFSVYPKGTVMEHAHVGDQVRIGAWKYVYTATFMDGDTKLGESLALGGDTFSAIDTPTKAGYTFAGWYTNAQCTKAYNFTTEVEDDITLYAKWEVAKYTVTWSINGASFTEQVEYGTTPTYSGVAPTKDGYTFTGWSPAITAVTGDVTYTAAFAHNTNANTVDNGNGTTTTTTTSETSEQNTGTALGITLDTTTEAIVVESTTENIETKVTASAGSSVTETTRSVTADAGTDTVTYTVTTTVKESDNKPASELTSEDVDSSKTATTTVKLDANNTAIDTTAVSGKSDADKEAGVEAAITGLQSTITTGAVSNTLLSTKLNSLAESNKATQGQSVTVDVELTLVTKLDDYSTKTVTNVETSATTTSATSITYTVTPTLTTVVKVGETETSRTTEYLKTADKFTDGSITFTLPIPTGFAAPNSTIQVKHVSDDGSIEYLTGTVSADATYVSVTANHFSSFELIPPDTYFVTFDAANGSDPVTTKYNKDATIVVPANPTRSGYSFNGWSPAVPATATASATYTAQWTQNSTGGYTGGGSSAPTPTTTITDEETPLSEFPIFYVDVAENAWYHDAIAYVTALDLMNGVGDDRFDPNANTTRGMVAVVMMRLAQGVAIDSESFFDVANDAYYAEAAAWAVENGVYEGYDDGSFRGELNITREQFAAVLYRYATAKGYDVSGKAELGSFTDSASVSGYAADAMAWAVDSGIIEGVGDNLLDPLGNATRAQLATMLMRFHALYTAEV